MLASNRWCTSSMFTEQVCLRAEVNEKLRMYAGGPVTRERKRLCVSRSSDAHV